MPENAGLYGVLDPPDDRSAHQLPDREVAGADRCRCSTSFWRSLPRLRSLVPLPLNRAHDAERQGITRP